MPHSLNPYTYPSWMLNLTLSHHSHSITLPLRIPTHPTKARSLIARFNYFRRAASQDSRLSYLAATMYDLTLTPIDEYTIEINTQSASSINKIIAAASAGGAGEAGEAGRAASAWGASAGEARETGESLDPPSLQESTLSKLGYESKA